MEINQVPAPHLDERPTGCCPRFHPEEWADQELKFVEKPFVRASTISFFHIPMNMDSVFTRTLAAIERAHAGGQGQLVLSHDTSNWHADHLFAVDEAVPGAEMVHLTGTFLTKVFEGSFDQMPVWCTELERYIQEKGRKLEDSYFYYTTCPRCAKVHGKNYVVGVAKVS